MMDRARDLQFDLAEIQRQLVSILGQRPSPIGASAERRPALGVPSLKMHKRRSGSAHASPYIPRIPRPRIRTTPVIASAVRSSVKTHFFPSTPPAPPKKHSACRRRRLHDDISDDFTLSCDASELRVSTNIDDVVNPALNDISVITSYSRPREQVSTNESHLQRIQFDNHDRPLHSTMSYPLHSTMTTALEASSVSPCHQTVLHIQDPSAESLSGVDECSQVTRTADLAASLGPNTSMRHWLHSPRRRQMFRTPTSSRTPTHKRAEDDSMVSNHPKGCFDVLRSTVKKRAKQDGQKKKQLTRKMKSFHKARSCHGSGVILLAEL
jgi:hypothetical protein